MTSGKKRSTSAAWDRVGQFMQQGSTIGQEMSDRNLALWAEVSAHLRADKYSADDMANDAATMMTAAMDNMADAWKLWSETPRSNTVAEPLPTVVLILEEVSKGCFSVADPVLIEPRVGAGKATLPASAEIELHGTGTISSTSAAELKRRVRVSRDEPSLVYRVETFNEKVADDQSSIEPGMYEGMIYLTAPAMALASLRIIVIADAAAPINNPGP